jgi:quercetin dioxygenase-like cupin family protein
MSDLAPARGAAHLVDPRNVETLDVMGATVELLTRPATDDLSPCAMRGTIPPGAVVPLHSHPDPETFVAVSGEVEGFAEADGGSGWVRIAPGDIFHVPGGAGHAFRNRSPWPAVAIVVSTSRMRRFFREIGTPVTPEARQPPGPPSAEAIQRFLETAARYGHWNATPEENAQVDLSLPAAP